MTACSSPTHEVRYALQGEATCDVLAVGSNVIGRGPAAEIDGLSFIAVESPRGAVSRAQATIEIAPNGDAWISDCGSTNGTYISLRPGTGIRLQPDRFYQLSEGCTLVFGDVERRFVAIDDRTAAASRSSRASAASSSKATPIKAFVEPVKAQRSASGMSHKATSQPTTVATSAPPSTTDGKGQTAGDAVTSPRSLREVPYLAELEPRTSIRSRKRAREGTVDTVPEAEGKQMGMAAAKAHNDVATPSPLGVSATVHVVCTSGLEAEEKTKVRQAAKRHGAKLTDDITKATLLVVGSPAVRTPKFIIAVARCIPIVTLDCLTQSEGLTPESVAAHAASLTDNGHTYTAKQLKSAICRADREPLLAGVTFNLRGLRGKGKQVAEEVLTGCGGALSKKSAAAADVTIDSDKALNELYDQILRGRRPPK